jgi:hypothetical protein
MAMDSLTQWFDPRTYTDLETYLAWWQAAWGSLTSGLIARIVVCVCLWYMFWYGVYKQRLATGLLFYLLALLIAYGRSLAWLLYQTP